MFPRGHIGGKNIPESAAMEYVSGYCLALDMTEREEQNEAKAKGLPWSAAKEEDLDAERFTSVARRQLWPVVLCRFVLFSETRMRDPPIVTIPSAPLVRLSRLPTPRYARNFIPCVFACRMWNSGLP